MSTQSDVAALLRANAQQLDTLATKLAAAEAENVKLAGEVAYYKKREECQKLASVMHERRLYNDPVEVITENLMHFPEEKIAQYKAALELQGDRDLYADYKLRSQEEPVSPYAGGSAKLSAQALDEYVTTG